MAEFAEEKIINENEKKLKEIFLKNKGTLIFSISAAFALLMIIVGFLYNNFIFGWAGWLLILIASIISIILAYYKKYSLIFIPWLILALILGVYIRTLPMQDHNGKPGLWDITTNTWTLGPDLDPFLFLRYAKEIASGELPKIDMMRNVPLGFDTSIETKLLPNMIAYTYKFLSLFNNTSMDYAAVIFPVIMFVLTIVSFFFFVREIFIAKDEDSKNKANIIAMISTFFMIVIPVFLSRTVAGIPEKESAAFFFMFLAFYLFLKAWKAGNLKKAIIFSALAGISTALMGLIWGGVSYVLGGIAIATLIAFIANKIHKKEFIIYSSWLISTLLLLLIFTNRFSIMGFITSLDSGLASLAFFIMLTHFAIWKTKIANMKFFKETKFPKNLISLIICFVLLIILASVFFGPGFIIEKIKVIHQTIFKPVIGRWSTTVAENRQPYFTEWGASFGPFIKGIPILFWMFFIGSVVLFKKILKEIKNKDAWILTLFYVLFLFAMVFSRYAAHPAILDGEGFASKALYYISALLFIFSLIYYYIKYHKEKNEGFEKIDYDYLLLFSLFILCIFTARGAVRLIMVLGPIAPIFASYLIIEAVYYFRKAEDETKKILAGILVVLFLAAGIFSFYSFYNEIKSQSYNFVPYAYTNQWQKAMEWVRGNTPENAVFAHWWDYGYWVQSIGDRATVTDGGNAITYWNYLTGRFVLTGDNQKDALEFLYNHNATHLLIDSSDIGKYGAYSSIGSDKNYDRISSGPVAFISDPKQIQETKQGIIRIYQGGISLDEDIIYNNNGTQIFLPSGSAGIAGVIVESIKTDNVSMAVQQPQAVFIYQGQQIKIPLRYIYYNGKLTDFNSGLEATAYIIQRLYQTSQGIQMDNMGAMIYVSPRITRTLFAQIYLLNDAFNKFPNFKLVHSQQNLFIESLNQQGANLGEFVYYEGIQGPIKIWKIEYSGDEKINPDYLLTIPPASMDWIL